MKAILPALLVAVAALGGCGDAPVTPEPKIAAQSSPKARESVAGGVAWGNDFAKALAEAKKTDKLVMLDFYADWCEYCKKLDIEAFLDKEVVELSKKTIPVKVNGEQNRPVSMRFGVDRFPMVLFIDKNGIVVGRIDGYLRPADFAAEMNKVLG